MKVVVIVVLTVLDWIVPSHCETGNTNKRTSEFIFIYIYNEIHRHTYRVLVDKLKDTCNKVNIKNNKCFNTNFLTGHESCKNEIQLNRRIVMARVFSGFFLKYE